MDQHDVSDKELLVKSDRIRDKHGIYDLRNAMKTTDLEIRTFLGSIPAGGPIVDEFFSTVPGWFFDMCMIQLELKTLTYQNLP